MDVDDMIGRKFGCLTVIRRIKTDNGGSKLAMLDARCDCGTRLSVVARDLRTGATLKCDRCYLVPLQQILARKLVAEARRAALQEKADRKKEERILRLRRKLADVRGITGNNGDGESR